MDFGGLVTHEKVLWQPGDSTARGSREAAVTLWELGAALTGHQTPCSLSRRYLSPFLPAAGGGSVLGVWAAGQVGKSVRAWEWSSHSTAGVSGSDFQCALIFCSQNVLSSMNTSLQGHPTNVHYPKAKDGADVTALSWSRALSVSVTTTNSFVSS